MPDSTPLLSSFTPLKRLRQLLEKTYGKLEKEVEKLFGELQDEEDLTQSKIEALQEMNSEANDRFIKELATRKAADRKVQRLQIEINAEHTAKEDLEKELAHKDEIIYAYEHSGIKVEAGGVLNQNHDSNVFNAETRDCDISAGKGSSLA